MKGVGRAVAIVLVLCASGPAAAQPTTPPAVGSIDAPVPVAPDVVARDAQGRVTVRAIRLAAPLTVDGLLDDAIYRQVPPISEFVQQEPVENAAASEPTDAWILFDADTLYITACNWDRNPSRMVLNELRRDSNNLIQNEQITITLDTFHDRRNGFVFLVNALGGMLEESFFDERNPSRDWNTVWNARTSRFDRGWIVEVAIPFKSLRYPPGSGHVWGIQLNRIIRHKNERTWLTPVPQSVGAQGVFRVSQAADLVGLETPPLSKNLEIKPYAIAGVTSDRTARPTPVVNDVDGDIGLDVKYGLTRSLTADFTYNTDFAQVEEDEQQVNLTRFSLFFPEKRDFFLEGQGIFNLGGRSATQASDTPILFFSRQIGIHGGRPVPIVAGGRLTGRAGAYNLGIVNIQTEDDPLADAPNTNFTVVRVRRDVLRRSTVGALYTGRSQGIRSRGSNETYAVDGVFSLFENVRINSYVARTETNGLRGDDLSYRGEYDYNADRWGFNVEHLAVGANFNPEVGFLRRSDFRKTFGFARFSPRPANPSSRIRKHYYEANYSYITTGSGRLESRLAGGAYRIEFQNSDRLHVEYNRSYELLVSPFPIASTVTIPSGSYGFGATGVIYQLGAQRRVTGALTAIRGSFYGGDQTQLSYRGRIAVATRLSFEPQVAVNWIDLPQGAFTTTLVSTRTTAPLTPRMFVSALLQYNSTTSSYSSNVRFRWEYQPGSELFVVYSEGRNTLLDGFPGLDSRGFVVKVNRLLRM
jgi:hypothetical protein